MTKSILCVTAILLLPALPGQEWRFAVSGDSRNCGDIVMPSIAAGAIRDNSQFYWHLGDFRAIFEYDEDILYARETAHRSRPFVIDYTNTAWDDFIQHQIVPFGSMPVYLGIGNHETIPPKTRADYLIQFADWLDTPEIRDQRLRDNPRDHKLRTYFHWIRDGIDFINMDNASPDMFDAEQLTWMRRIIERDRADSHIRALVVGMHAALPDSLAAIHSMNNYPASEQTGRALYQELVRFHRNTKKAVYLLASHSHYYMDGIFETAALKAKNEVLPGWIIGTAGAIRYPLPSNAGEAHAAKTNVYGYLIATVTQDAANPVRFEFKEVPEEAVSPAVVSEYGRENVHTCFVGNAQRPAPAAHE